MGKDESLAMRRHEREVAQRPVEQSLPVPSEVWVYVCPNTQRQILVSELGVSQGEVVSSTTATQLQRCGICEEVSYHAAYDQYWKMPSQTAIMRMPSVYGIEALPITKIKLTTQLVKPGEPRGFWMRIRLRTEAEMPQAAPDAENSTVS